MHDSETVLRTSLHRERILFSTVRVVTSTFRTIRYDPFVFPLKACVVVL